MRTFHTLLFISVSAVSFSQIEGTWRLARQGGALAVGPNQGDGSWWSIPIADTLTRDCLFDDSITFDNSGTMTHYVDDGTWLEFWQHGNDTNLDNTLNSDDDLCGTPIAPHDGTTNAPFSYTYDSGAGTLTVNGTGAHLGLPKATNGAELTDPANAPSSVTYQVSFVNNDNTMIADINFGPGWWRFIYERTDAQSVPNPNITFQVDMSQYAGTIGTGVYLNGDFNNWCGDCTPMTNVSGDLYEVAVPLPIGSIQYKFTVDGWTDQELFDGTASCIDPIDDGFYNRYYSVDQDATLPPVCFNSCEICSILEISEKSQAAFTISPNPADDIIHITSETTIDQLVIFDLSGKKVGEFQNSTEIAIEHFEPGTYILKAVTEQGPTTSRFVVK